MFYPILSAVFGVSLYLALIMYEMRSYVLALISKGVSRPAGDKNPDPAGVLAQAQQILENHSKNSVVAEAERLIRGG